MFPSFWINSPFRKKKKYYSFWVNWSPTGSQNLSFRQGNHEIVWVLLINQTNNR